jgi:hypothetical protein
MNTYTLGGLRWAISAHGCDPARYLGEVRLLPAVEEREPGDWCDLVVRDEEQASRWTLVVVDDGDGKPGPRLTRAA